MPLPDLPARQRRLATALKTLREKGELSATEAAEGMGEGLSFGATIERWESAEAAPSADELWRFIDAVGATFAELEVEVDPSAKNPALEQIAAQLDAMGREPGDSR